MSAESTAARALAAFRRAFPNVSPSSAVSLAPGRVNLIGEHTDYNDGFVLPAAIDRYAALAFAPSAEPRIRAYAEAFDETVDLALPIGARESDPIRWSDYVAGVAWAVARGGEPVPGFTLALVGDVPIGAGLSSSAALELAVARAIRAVQGREWNAVANAQIGRTAEVDYVGVRSGIMDQIASACSAEDAALLVDCRSLELRTVPIPDDVAMVVLDTRVRRGLASSEYNVRRASCEAALEVLRRHAPDLRALRDVSRELLESARAEMDDVTYRRASHVVGEMGRPAALAAALGANDLRRAGDLMRASHESLRDLYEVSSPELDAMVAAATRHPGCIGARMTGAGFGGCAVALATAAAAEDLARETVRRYGEATGREGAAFATRSVAGARLTEA